MSIRKVQATNLFLHVGCGDYWLRHLQKVKHKKELGLLTGLYPPLPQTSYWVPLTIEITKLQCHWFQGESEVCTGAKWSIQWEVISVSIWHPPPHPHKDGILVHHKVISQHFMRLPWQIASTYLYSSVNKKCFAQEHNSLTPPHPGLKSGPFNLKTSTLTVRPPHLLPLVSKYWSIQ